MYSISHFSLPLYISSLIIFIISVYVFLKNPRSRTHQSFLYFCLSLAVWIFSFGRAYSSTTPESAEYWTRLGFLGIAFIPSTNFYFYSHLLGIKNRFLNILFFCVSGVLLAIHSESNLIQNGTEEFFWGSYASAGSLHWVFILFCSVVWMLGVRMVWTKMEEKKMAGDNIGYNQTKYVFLGLVGEGLGTIDFLPFYGISVYPVGYLVALYWCAIVAFAITRYKVLMDISFHTRRVFIGSAFLLEAVAYYLVAAYLNRLLHVDSHLYLAVISMVGGLLAVPLARATTKGIDQAFFPEFFEREEKLASLGQEILRCKSSVEFNQIILDKIFNSFRITRSYLYLWNEEKKSFRIQSETLWGSFVMIHKTADILPNQPIPKYLETSSYLLLDDIRRDNAPVYDQRALSLEMLEMGVSLCIPVRYGSKMTGLFLFGDKESGLPYSKEDIKALSLLAGHTGIAAENIDLSKRWSQEASHASQVDKILHTYMSSSVADEVLSHANHDQGWKGEKRHATILMSDLRGFTHLSERYTPEEIVHTLNDYFTVMIETIMENGGTVDKFMGDAILAVFGVPKPIPESEKSAVICGLQMHDCLKRLNRRREADNLFTLQMGIGIAAGDVVAGNIGSNKRREYTVIGDAVNTASRIQAIASSGKILVTNKILDKVTDIVRYERMAPIVIKGKSHPMEIIEISGHIKDLRGGTMSDPDIIELPLFSNLPDKKAL